MTKRSVFNFKNIIFVSVATIICVVLCLSSWNNRNEPVSPPLSYSVVIDPGHGGIDSGAIGVKTGNKESELNLDLSFELEKYLSTGGLDTLLTRTTHDGLYGDSSNGFKRRDMQERKRIIEEADPDIVLSIHMNKFPSASRRGAQVYYQKGDEQSKALALVVQEVLNTRINIPELGRGFEPGEGDFYICKIKKPAIIVECGFLSNPSDDSLLSKKSYRKRLAYTLYSGIVQYLVRETAFTPKSDSPLP